MIMYINYTNVWEAQKKNQADNGKTESKNDRVLICKPVNKSRLLTMQKHKTRLATRKEEDEVLVDPEAHQWDIQERFTSQPRTLYPLTCLPFWRGVVLVDSITIADQACF